MGRHPSGLEQLFLQCNVRFAAAASFPAVPVRKAIGALRHALHTTALDAAEVSKAESSGDEVIFWLSEGGTEASKVREITVHPMEHLELSRQLADVIAADTSAEGSVPAHLFTNGEGECVAAVLNANHALCDGRTMRVAIEALLKAIASSEECISDAVVLCNTPLLQLDELLLHHPSTRVPDGDPSFLPINGSILPLAEIGALQRKGPTSSLASNAIVNIASDIIKKCRNTRDSSSFTVTGLLVACLVQALSEAYREGREAPVNERTSIAVSVLVDLRPYLPPEHSPLQAFGTVTVGLPIAAAVDGIELQRYLIDTAVEASAQIRKRIERGEAHRQALLFWRGEFESGQPPATVELSNHGVYQTTPGSEVALDQRFDGYEGISISAHSESTSGTLRMCASAGDSTDTHRLGEVLRRLVFFCSTVAQLQ